MESRERRKITCIKHIKKERPFSSLLPPLSPFCREYIPQQGLPMARPLSYPDGEALYEDTDLSQDTASIDSDATMILQPVSTHAHKWKEREHGVKRHGSVLHKTIETKLECEL